MAGENKKRIRKNPQPPRNKKQKGATACAKNLKGSSRAITGQYDPANAPLTLHKELGTYEH